MAVEFNSIEFSVVVDGDGNLPYPTPDINGMLSYSATILLASQADYLSLLAMQSKTTVLPALGGGGLVVVERGTGRKTLIIPLSNSAEATYSAVLTGISAQARAFQTGSILAECEWVIVSAVDV